MCSILMKIKAISLLFLLLSFTGCGHGDKELENEPVAITISSPDGGPFEKTESIPVNVKVKSKWELLKCEIKVYDQMGRSIYSYDIADIHEKEINVSQSIPPEFEEGIYFFKVHVFANDEEFTSATKILII